MSILTAVRNILSSRQASKRTTAAANRKTVRQLVKLVADESTDVDPQTIIDAVEADGRGFDDFNAAVNRELERRQIAADDTNRDALAQEYTKLLSGIQELRDSIPVTVRRIEDQIRAAEKELSRNELARLRLQRQDTRLRDIEAADAEYFGSEAAR